MAYHRVYKPVLIIRLLSYFNNVKCNNFNNYITLKMLKLNHTIKCGVTFRKKRLKFDPLLHYIKMEQKRQNILALCGKLYDLFNYSLSICSSIHHFCFNHLIWVFL